MTTKRRDAGSHSTIEESPSAQRSRVMSHIRSTDTAPERVLRNALWRAGVRYRLHVRKLSGCPDIVIENAQLAIFIDGCFWHGCPRHYVRPKTRQEYWDQKIQRNVRRRVRVTEDLSSAGWAVIAIRECEVRENLDACLRYVLMSMRARATEARTS